ncbi:MAG: hypothetical protein C5B52_00100 [Bacteroidetes bacterium]|nr:MAG: hypothetical protein C5B52_00100 [Bacteroidota bacterium]
MKKGGIIIWCFCILMILSCIIISSQKPMWLDELYSFYSTQDSSLSHSIQGIANGVNAAPPFYFMLTWCFYKVGIHEILFYRMLSSICFISALILLWRLLRKYYDEAIVIGSVIICFGASNLIFAQNSEFRNYALFFLLESLALIQAVYLIEKPDSQLNLILLAIFLGLGCLTHIFGVFYGMAFLASFIVYDLIQKKIQIKRWIACIAGTSFIIVWVNQIITQSQMGKPHSWIPVPDMGAGIETFSSLFPFGDRVNYQNHSTLLLIIFISIVSLTLYLLMRNSGRLVYKIRNIISASNERKFLGILSIAIILIPLVISYFLSRAFTSIFLLRYLIPSILGVLLLFINIFSLDNLFKPQLLRYVLPVLMILGFLRFGYSTLKYRDQNISSLAQVEARARAEKMSVIFQSPQFFMPFQYYFNSVRAYYPLDWKVASEPSNALCATSDYKSMERLRNYYKISGVSNDDEIVKPGKVYYLVDEPGKIWLKYYLAQKKASVLESHLLPNGFVLKKIVFN